MKKRQKTNFFGLIRILCTTVLEEKNMDGVTIKQRRHHLHYHQNAVMMLLKAFEHYFTNTTVLKAH